MFRRLYKYKAIIAPKLCYICPNFSLMFNRYWREYPWALQITLFGLMAFTLTAFSFVVVQALIPKISGISIAAIQDITTESTNGQKSAFLWMQGIVSAFGFMIPPVLFAYLSTPRVKEYLGIRMPKKPLHIILGITMMAGAMPILLEIAGLIKNLNLGTANDAAQNKIEQITEALLDIKSVGQLVQVLVVMAVIPGIAEELFFRGILLRFGHQRAGKMVLPIIISSIIFAAVHDTPYNLVSIAIAGALLCLVYYWSGSLVTAMIAHMVYNGSQIYLSYAAKDNAALKELAKTNHMPPAILITGIIVFLVSILAFWKTRNAMPANWSANFTPEEIQAKNEHI